jgi:hypothetical protein
MIKTLLTAILLSATTLAVAQDFKYKNYGWETTPVIHSLTVEEEKEGAVIVKDARIIEYALGEDARLYMAKTLHKIIRVNTDKAMEEYNKVYVPVTNQKIVSLRARSISKSGKVVEMDNSSMKELKNVGEYGNFKIFAIEGLEKGGEVEYMYTLLSSPRESGREVMQSDVKVKNATLQILSPQNVEVVTQSYNGFPQLDIQGKSKIILTAQAENIPALREEAYTTRKANLMKVDYKIASFINSYGARVDVSTWKIITDNYNKIVFEEKPKEYYKVNKLLKNLKVETMSEEQKIKTIEQYIKNNITLRDGDGAAYISIDDILSNKYGNELGLIRLYQLCLKTAGVNNYQVLVTSNRYEARFDQFFANYTNLQHFLLYFPKYNKYLSPINIEYRYGIAPYMFANNHSLTLNTATIHFIEEADTTLNYIRKDVKLAFPTQMDYAEMKVAYAWNGHRAAGMRGAYHFQDEKGREEFIKGNLSSGIEDAQIISKKLINEKMDYTAENQDFILQSSLKAGSLMEKAGNDIIFNVGKVIGTQTELYQENERQQDMDMTHPIQYLYQISFTIPAGYTVKGMDDLVMDHYIMEKKEKIAQFSTKYSINGQNVTLQVKEFYTKSDYSKKNYETFRKVINAAADFSKTVLVFEKISN